MAEEIILTTFVSPKTHMQYALTQTESFDPKEGKKLALKEIYTNGELAPYTIREKTYLDGGKIVRSKPLNYYIESPKNGSGTIALHDGDYLCDNVVIKGKLKNGKIVSLERLDQVGRHPRCLLNGDSDFTRMEIERLLRQAKIGKFKFQNATEVILKKILAYLPK